jgi:nucleoside-diphosphate-sugar epimerase
MIVLVSRGGPNRDIPITTAAGRGRFPDRLQAALASWPSSSFSSERSSVKLSFDSDRPGRITDLERMRALVTGSAGHLGEAIVRALRDLKYEVVGLDILASPFTTDVGSITDRSCVGHCMRGVQAVFPAATRHTPHVATHSRQDFVDTNITGTLNLLEEAVTLGVESFDFTSTTSVFGNALVPPARAAAAWVTEDVTPVPKNIYGVTKAAAEDLCQLFRRNQGLACIVLRTARFFPRKRRQQRGAGNLLRR